MQPTIAYEIELSSIVVLGILAVIVGYAIFKPSKKGKKDKFIWERKDYYSHDLVGDKINWDCEELAN